MSSATLKNFLIAPLDWGLGHTSRCIPIIKYLQASGHKVVFAGNEWQIDFIYKTFPGIESAHLQGYNISYSHSAKGFMPAILRQVPKILYSIRSEHQWLLKLCTKHHFDGIISDNRYGLHHPGISSVIMSHQLQVRTGMGKISDRIFRKLHYGMLQHFNHCWVVDVAGKPNLGAALAHPGRLPRNAAYMGLLSQFEPAAKQDDGGHLLIMLSGPEPQRSILASILWQQVQHYNGRVVFVEGSNDFVFPAEVPAHIQYHRQLTKEALLPLIEGASMVICRSGYSSLMDLAALHKKAILIPTPGQTEQEYLARHMQHEHLFYTADQAHFNLGTALHEAASFPFETIPFKDAFSQYKAVIDKWLLSLPPR